MTPSAYRALAGAVAAPGNRPVQVGIRSFFLVGDACIKHVCPIEYSEGRR